MTGNPEVICSSVGFVPTNALVLTGVAKCGLAGFTESPLMTVDLRGAAYAASRISSTLKEQH